MVGAGGHARSVADALQGVEIAAFVVETGAGEHHLEGVTVWDEPRLIEIGPDGVDLVNGVGQVTPGGPRRECFERLVGHGFRFRTVVHSTGYVSTRADLAIGVQVLANAVVGPGASIGDNSLVNTGAVVEHDCHIGRSVHIAPGAVVCGSVRVGDGTMIGAGATIVPGCSIGALATVGAGAVVLHDVPPGGRVAGVPATDIGQ